MLLNVVTFRVDAEDTAGNVDVVRGSAKQASAKACTIGSRLFGGPKFPAFRSLKATLMAGFYIHQKCVL